MELYTRERTRSASPVKPFVDLDVGAVDIKEAALSFAFVVGMLLAAAAGAFILKLSFTREHWNFLSGAFGLLVALVAIYLGYAVLTLTLERWRAHQARIAAWDEAALAGYVGLGGGSYTDEVTEYSFSADNPLHVAWCAIEVMRRIRAGDDTPWAIRRLRGPLFLGARRVGELSKTEAERMGARFAELGFIEGRCEGYAGRWCVETAERVFDVVADARWA